MCYPPTHRVREDHNRLKKSLQKKRLQWPWETKKHPPPPPATHLNPFFFELDLKGVPPAQGHWVGRTLDLQAPRSVLGPDVPIAHRHHGRCNKVEGGDVPRPRHTACSTKTTKKDTYGLGVQQTVCVTIGIRAPPNRLCLCLSHCLNTEEECPRKKAPSCLESAHFETRLNLSTL